MSAEAQLSIGAFARAARLTVKALRHYHEVGVLVPARVDPRSNYRFYGRAQLADALVITMLRDLGVGLDQIRSHLVGGIPLSELLACERTRLEREAARAHRALAVIDALATPVPPTEIEIVSRCAVRTLTASCVAHGDTLAVDAAALIERLLGAADALGLDTAPAVIGEYPADLSGAITIRAHLPVDDTYRELTDAPVGRGSGLGLGELAACTAATLTHVGPIEALPLAYHRLSAWMAAEQHPMVGPLFERYLDDPARTSPAATRTEVFHRLSS